MTDPDAEKMRIYTVRDGGEPRLLATCQQDALGIALTTLHHENEFDRLRVGVLEKHQGPDAPGRWVVNPYSR